MLFVPSARPLVKVSTSARRSYIELSKIIHTRRRPLTCSSAPNTRCQRTRLIWRQPQKRYSSQCIPESDSSRSINAFINAFDFPASTHSVQELSKADIGQEVVIHGYLGPITNTSKTRSFVWLYASDLERCIQIYSGHLKGEELHEDSPHAILKTCTQHTPVAIRGIVSEKPPAKSQATGESSRVQDVEIQLKQIHQLNKFPSDLMMEMDTVFGPEQRHLQLRTTPELRDALGFRADVAQICREQLRGQGFTEIETPLLFKSTPEGAREFLVPTRTKGLAYALPQSPQQYKQILMASGIPKYFQVARCFRDEDLRADRQPEFTQIDLEMSFAKGEQVMNVIENLLVRLWETKLAQDIPTPITRMTYSDAMAKYGSDKPDTRLGMELHSVGELLPVDLVSKIGPLTRPAVDVMKLSLSGSPSETRKFINNFMDSPEATPFLANPDGQPGIFIFDSRQPLEGLQPFGFQTAEYLEDTLGLSDGDLIVLQARKNEPFFGGSTSIGRLRLALHEAAVAQGLIPPPTGFKFLWITDFPLFSPSTASEPGQGGTAGLASTHHPFTSPKSAQDVALLSTNPDAVIGEHYDIVVNGVELGGGSKRIHSAAMQEFILRDVLKMTPERLAEFRHLIDVLGAGCPPHAGIALGFDRLVAVMLGRESVRDVIAFPKSGSGEDAMVKSPTKISEAQLRTYHLQLVQ